MANEKTGTLQFQMSDGSYVAGYPKTTLAQVIGGQDAIATAKSAAISTAGTNADAKYPTKDGTGASGSWGISITGKANTAGTADTAKACTGNAATATKLATARTIALSGDATGSATFDGLANITVPVTFTRTDGLTNLCPDGAAAHNCFYRGKDITADFTSGKMSTNIANGTFRDIFIGDYITKTVTVDGTAALSSRWLVADCDYKYQFGDSWLPKHHVVLVSEGVLAVNTRMNAENTTAGGYQGSEMWKTTIPKWAEAIKSAFGSSHVLTHRSLLSKAISADAPSPAGAGWKGSASDWSWTDVTCNILSEAEVYGHQSSSGIFDCGECKSQLALFRLSQAATIARVNGGRQDKWYWLRNVASASTFAVCHGIGYADYADAAYQDVWSGLRLGFLLA